MKNLIIYYSRRGQNYVNGSIKNLARGNAEVITECALPEKTDKKRRQKTE